MNSTQKYHVYILECADGTLYTGITTDVLRRFREHQEGIGSRYTRAKKAVTIVYCEEAGGRGDASKREIALKKMSRKEKMTLIASWDGTM